MTLNSTIASAMPATSWDQRLVILGHHYQRDEVIKFADLRGDSFKLAQWASTQKDAEYIVFCGVHFMAESADILSASYQKVVLPDMSAGCSMADMAAFDQVETCWSDLAQVAPGKIVPITYMNSTAAIKAFCGRHDGAVCTSSNADAVMRWALERGDRILFLPDQHLGRNTGYRLGMRLEEMPVWDPYEELGGNTAQQSEQQPCGSVEGALFGTPALFAAACGAGPFAPSGHSRHSPSGMPVRGRSACR